jgi:hypothetical protein
MGPEIEEVTGKNLKIGPTVIQKRRPPLFPNCLLHEFFENQIVLKPDGVRGLFSLNLPYAFPFYPFTGPKGFFIQKRGRYNQKRGS